MDPARPEEIEARLAEILARDEMRDLQNDAAPATKLIGELLDSILAALRALAGDLGANHPGIFALLLILGTGVLAASIWYGARGAARRRNQDARIGVVLPEELRGDPARLRADAETAAAEKRWLDAVRLLFRATIIERAMKEGSLEKMRDVSAFRRARTYRELIAEFARSEKQATSMRELAARIELGLYGNATLDEHDFEHARLLARELS